MVLVIRAGAEIGDDATQSGEKRADERSIQVYLRKLHCNHAGLIEDAGTIGASMIAACALALVSSRYNTIKDMRAAR